MAVWTISWEAGTGGDQIGRRLAEQAEVPLVDRQVEEAIARTLGLSSPELAAELERHPPGPLLKAGLTAALSFGCCCAEALSALRLLPTLRTTTEQVLAEAARRSCVVLGHGGFAVLADHPAAVHVRILAPLAWRVERHARTRLLGRGHAEEELRRNERLRSSYLSRLYQIDVNDPGCFDLVCDVSRLPPERVVEALLAAGGRPAQLLAHV